MKQILYGTTLLVLSLAICLYASHFVSTLTEEVEHSLVSVLAAPNTPTAQQKAEEASMIWSGAQSELGIFLHHEDVDGISENLAQLCAYDAGMEKDDFLSTCHTLLTQLGQLRKMQIPCLCNIL